MQTTEGTCRQAWSRPGSGIQGLTASPWEVAGFSQKHKTAEWMCFPAVVFIESSLLPRPRHGMGVNLIAFDPLASEKNRSQLL